MTRVLLDIWLSQKMAEYGFPPSDIDPDDEEAIGAYVEGLHQWIKATTGGDYRALTRDLCIEGLLDKGYAPLWERKH